MKVMVLAANSAVSPFCTVFEFPLLKLEPVAFISRFPPELASKSPAATAALQSAVAVGNVKAAPLVFDPPEAAGKLVELFVTATRAYEPPDSSVPEVASPGATEKRPTYSVAGGVYVVAERM